MKVLTYITI